MEMNNETKKFSFLKYIIGAVVVLVFAIVLAFNYSLKNTYVYAAAVNIGVDGLSANSSGDASWTYSNGSITGTVKATSTGGCDPTYTQKTGTLTLTNTTSEKYLISFDYTINKNNGTVTVADQNKTSDGSYDSFIEPNATIVISISSGTSDTEETKIIIKNIEYNSTNQKFLVTFEPSDEGLKYYATYGEENIEITNEEIPVEISISNSINLSIDDPRETGYKIFSWIIDDDPCHYLENATSITFSSAITIKPDFCNSDAAIFTTKAGGVYYKSLTEANSAASAASSNIPNAKIIVPYGTETIIPAGDYEISSGVTLLIPYNSSNDFSTSTMTKPTTADSWSDPASAPTLFKRLILSSGVRIDVKGNVCVNSIICGQGQANGHNGTPTGPHGEIHLDSNSMIELKNGSKFTCWGFVSGTGLINALSGSVVYECFQLKDFRGGTATSNMVGNNQKIMPFNQYFVQNIECHLRINSGAVENLYSCVTLSVVGTVDLTPTLIGGTSDTAMFKITNGNVDKYYDVSRDRLIITINGDVTISNIKMTLKVTLATKTIDSNDYVLPINSNMDINIATGKLSTSSSQNIFMMPEATLTVSSGAEFVVNSNLYLYDKTNWVSGYTFGAVGYKIDYISARDRNTCSNPSTRMSDYPHYGCTLDINGTVTISSTGNIFTTIGTNDSYANVISSGKTGKITRKSDLNSSTYQFTSANEVGTYATIACITARLKNGDGTYYINDKDVSIIEYDFNADKWGIDEETIYTYTIIFKYNNETVEQSFNSDEIYTFPDASIFTTVPDYVLKLWNPSNIVNRSFAPGSIINGSEGSPLDGEEYTPYFGGFLQDGNDWYFIDYYGETVESKITGLYRTLNQEEIDISVFYFDSEGKLLIDAGGEYNLVNYNDDFYYIDFNGIMVENAKLVEITIFDTISMVSITNYYYFGKDNKAYKDGVFYIETTDSVYTSGYYRFDSNGHLLGKVTHGLIQTNSGDYFYIDSTNNSVVDTTTIDSSESYVVTNKTVYVIDFDSSVAEQNRIVGLYYFGADGKLVSYKEVS